MKVNRVSSRLHPEFQAEEVGMSLSHVVEAAGAELPGATYISAFSSALIAGNGLTEAP